MENLKKKTFDFINYALNSSNAKEISFYDDILKEISSVFEEKFSCFFSSIVFLEDESFSIKSLFKFSDEKKFNLFLNNSKTSSFLDDFLSDESSSIKAFKADFFEDFSNILFSKLKINNSIFGFLVFSSSEEFSLDEIQSIQVISSVLSYKIKDYELSCVYKMQLNSLQNAIEDKAQAYELIQKQHKKLEKLDKEKNLFLANISHELRTPLNAIIGFSQALDSKIFGELNEKQAEYIKDIQISGLHLLGMINEILDISKLEAHAMKFSPSPINATYSIFEVVNILEPLYKNKNIDVEFDSTKEIKIFADNQKFQQILYNLLSNAIKFTPEKGKIKIRQKKLGCNYFLEIEDNGIGIEKKNQNKIFKKYVHLSNSSYSSQNSTGLGLPITKELVKLHGGKITLVSELNSGSKFMMEFKNIAL